MAAKSDALFTELAAQAKEGDHEKALATAEKILQAQPNDADALASKLVCLVHLGRFEDVLKLTESKADLQFERAYAYYRLKQLPEALRIVRALPKSARAQTLEAQTLYRLEDYAASSALFKELYAKNQTAELRVNLMASYVAQGDVKEALNLATSTKENTYEVTYNLACAQIEAGNLPAAIEALNVAEKICKANLVEDGASEEEIKDEMAVIFVQKACVLQMMAIEEEALTIYTETLARKPSDAVVAAVAANNVVMLRHDHDLFDSLKKVKSAATPATESKLSTAQKKAIHINHCLVLLKMNKADQAKELVQTLQAQMPQSYLPTVIEAAIFSKDKKNPTKSEELLSAYVAAHPKDSDYVRMCLAQIAFAKDDIKGAAAALSQITSLQHRPATVATLVKLYTQLGDIASANAVFDAALAYWPKAGTPDDRNNIHLLTRECINFKMANRMYSEAAKLLQGMLIWKGIKEADVLPQLVLALAHTEPAAAETYARRLPGFARTPVDAVALENAPSYRLGAPVKEETTAAAPSAAQKATEEKQKKRRKRKKRLPKNFDPNKQPDPERWLPKRERYASRKGKKKGAALRGPQGATGVTAAEGSKDASKDSAPAPEAATAKPATPQPKGAKGKAEAKAAAAPSSLAPTPGPAKPAAAESPASSPQGSGKRRGKK